MKDMRSCGSHQAKETSLGTCDDKSGDARDTELGRNQRPHG
uniref:Uncharacterized protein n=1 Tax=Peronospora matthiolae TaxID=2874970 RepID=A0AAV1UTH0_9STRA